jgi:hypothetical protein
MSHTKQLTSLPKLFQLQNCRRDMEVERCSEVEELSEHDLEFRVETEVEKVEKGVSPDRNKVV